MNELKSDTCLTCLGAGEVSSERGVTRCPDCDGTGKIGDVYLTNEHRIREIEQKTDHLTGELEQDMSFLITQLRSCRAALIKIMSAAQDGTDGSHDLFRRIQFEANEALHVYASRPPGESSGN